MQKLISLKSRTDVIVDDFIEVDVFYSYAEMVKSNIEQRAKLKLPSYYKYEVSYDEYIPDENVKTIWDNKWDTLIINGVASLYKDSESSNMEAAVFQNKFEAELGMFIDMNQLPLYYQDDDTTQTVQTNTILMTKQTYNGDTSNTKIYKNGVRVTDITMYEWNDNYTMSYLGSFVENTDYLTVTWNSTNNNAGRKRYGW